MDYIKLGKILQDARNNLGIKQIDVANKLGCTSANVSSWERGKSKIDIDSFAELCDMYKLDFAKILEEISNNDNEPKTDHLTSDEKIYIKKYRTLDEYGKKAVDDLLDNEYKRCQEEKKIKVIQLPLSELKVSAGIGSWIEDNRYGTIEVADTPESRKADLVIEINGNSMEPTYHNGDNVLVRLQPSVDIGEIGVFVKGSEGYIKELGKNRLISRNKEYEDIIFNEYSDIHCVGKVIGVAEVIR